MSSQDSYSTLLQGEGLGDGLYYPNPDVRLGDVAYFTDVTYHILFNVFQLTSTVRPGLFRANISRTLLEWASFFHMVRETLLACLSIGSLLYRGRPGFAQSMRTLAVMLKGLQISMFIYLKPTKQRKQLCVFLLNPLNTVSWRVLVQILHFDSGGTNGDTIFR